MGDAFEPVVQVALGISAIVACVFAIWKLVKPMVTILRGVREFLDDWRGEPARDGVPERPGVMARIAEIEARTQRTEWHVGNGDPVPLRQMVTATQAALDAHVGELPQHVKALDDVKADAAQARELATRAADRLAVLLGEPTTTTRTTEGQE